LTKRVVFMGTPAFAGPALAALDAVKAVDVALVVTQPDRPAGRGRNLAAPPVKELAIALGLEVYQPVTLRDKESRAPLVTLEPDLVVVAAYGLILGRSILELPPAGCVNLHASLLPKYRGASPVAASLLEGDDQTGVSLMRMERGLDTGPVFATRAISIEGADTTESLTSRLANVAAELVIEHLPSLLDNTIVASSQPPAASLTRPLSRADGWVDWSASAVSIERRVRAMWSWPRAWTTLPSGTSMQIHQATVVQAPEGAQAGEVIASRGEVAVACGEGALRIERGQLAGRNALEGAQLATVRDLAPGTVLGTTGEPAPQGPIVSPVAG